MDLVTGDLSENELEAWAPMPAGGSPLTLQQRNPFPTPRPHSSAATPQSSRLEVVLNSSPRYQHPLSHHADYSSDGRKAVVQSQVNHSAKAAASPLTRQKGPARRAPTAGPSTPATAEEPPKRKRGRPKGWRPGLSYSGKPLTPVEVAERIERARLARSNAKPKTPAAARTKNAADGTGKTGKKRGRPAKPSVPHSIFRSLRREFLTFGCEWQGCRAELQNMATLRRHVMVVHGQAEACRWGRCARMAGTEAGPLLATHADFEEHVEEAHLMPYQRHMGDGFRNSIVLPPEDSGDLPLYLFGADGTQVTPSVRDQKLEDFATRRANRKRLRELLMLRDANAPFEDEDDNDADGLEED